MKWTFNDGGRAAAGFKGDARDCAVRAIAIATETPYGEVYEGLRALMANGRTKGTRAASPRNGVPTVTARAYLERRGWKWVPVMKIGSGVTMHLRPDEVPAGRIVARVSRHYTAVIDGVVHDTHDCTREGTRAVYGYFWNKEQSRGY